MDIIEIWLSIINNIIPSRQMRSLIGDCGWWCSVVGLDILMVNRFVRTLVNQRGDSGEIQQFLVVWTYETGGMNCWCDVGIRSEWGFHGNRIFIIGCKRVWDEKLRWTLSLLPRHDDSPLVVRCVSDQLSRQRRGLLPTRYNLSYIFWVCEIHILW